jgi:hypothetical protein
MATTATVPTDRPNHSKRVLLLIFACCAAPVIASYFAYYVMQPARRINYGELLPVLRAPDVGAQRVDGRSLSLAEFKGKWVLLQIDAGGCAEACLRKLYATRQARSMQNAEAERIVRVWLVRDSAPPRAMLLAEHPGLAVAHAGPETLRWLPAAGSADDYVYLLDPLGNLMMRFPANPDIKALSRDLARLLKASRIG